MFTIVVIHAHTTEPMHTDFIYVDEESEPLNLDEIRKQITIPDTIRQAGITGKVVFRILVNREGKVEKYLVIRHVPFLTEAIESHLRELRFTPAIKDDQPVLYWVSIPFQIHILD